MINYHNIVFPFLHRHGCRQEADSNFRDFARTSQIKSSIRQSRSLRINNKSWKINFANELYYTALTAVIPQHKNIFLSIPPNSSP